MLSRSHSERSQRIRRSKSSSSVTNPRNNATGQDVLHSGTARRYAVAAANVAMERAQGRFSVNQQNPLDLRRANSVANIPSTQSSFRPSEIRLNYTAAAELRRQRSILRQQAPALSPILQLPDDDLTMSCTSATSVNEFGVPLGYGSTPSSYRRLRKAKSMIAPGKRAMTNHGRITKHSGSPRTLHAVHRTIDDANINLKLSLRRSLSFLRGNNTDDSRSASGIGPSSEPYDVAIQRAQDQFAFDLEEQRLKSRPGIFSTRARREQKAFRKTVRTGKGNLMKDAISSPNQPVPTKASTVSPHSLGLSIQKTVKRMFGRSFGSRTGVPAQHLDASRLHFGDYVQPPARTLPFPHERQPGQGGRESTVLGAPMQGPSVKSHDETQFSYPQCSFDSITDASSRISSWTNSTFDTTVTARLPVDQKRLSIIQEHASHYQPSSSIGRHLDEVSVFRAPSRIQPDACRSEPSVDPQRLYSALMRRIDESEAKERGFEDQGAKADELQTEHGQNSIGHALAPGFTIRTVPKTHHSNQSSGAYGDNAASTDFGDGPSPHDSDNWMSTGSRAKLERKRKSSRSSEMKSSFFPFSDEEQPETPSPYRAVLTAKRECALSSETGSVIHHPAASTGSPNSCSAQSSCDFSREPDVRYLKDTNDNWRQAGTATIYTDAGRTYSRPLHGTARLHEARSNSTIKWKSWVNSQVANITKPSPPPGQFQSSKSFDLAHHREDAQIDGEDTALGYSAKGRKDDTPSPVMAHRTQLRGAELAELSLNSIYARRRSSGQSMRSVPNSNRIAIHNDENALPSEGTRTRSRVLFSKPSQPTIPVVRNSSDTDPYELGGVRSNSPGANLTPTPQHNLSRPAAHRVALGQHNHAWRFGRAERSDDFTANAYDTIHFEKNPSRTKAIPTGTLAVGADAFNAQQPEGADFENQTSNSRLGTAGKRLLSGFLRSRRRALGSSGTTATESRGTEELGTGSDEVNGAFI